MNKITKQSLENEIDKIEYTRLTGTLTHCGITVKNGFVFTGESSCIDPKNFDEEIGKQIAYENAFDKMWSHYGFLVKNLMDDYDNISPKLDIFDFGTAISLLKHGKKVCRKGWNGKGMYLFLVDGKCVSEAVNDCYGDPTRHELGADGYEKGQSIAVIDAIYMKTADNKLVPWLASQTDVLAEDWVVVE